ncbi:MAG: response regulator transcription factor [Telluria sp.]
MRLGILEDDATQVEFYRLWLSTAQHHSVFYPTIAAFCAGLTDEKFDLLLIDRELPDGNGEQALAWVRANLGWEVPVIFVTASSAEADIVQALRMGANDYVIKPPKYFELIARIEAQARRSKAEALAAIDLGAYQLDLQNRQIRLVGKQVELTQKEYELACYMFQHPQRLLSRVHLLETIWGFQAEIDTRTVDTHVSRLRRKLKIGPANGWEIVSIYGYGYRIEMIEPGS